jgi:hypothetical protein
MVRVFLFFIKRLTGDLQKQVTCFTIDFLGFSDSLSLFAAYKNVAT